MAEEGFHRGGVVHVAPRPLIRVVDGYAIDRMNEGAVKVTVTFEAPPCQAFAGATLLNDVRAELARDITPKNESN